MARIKGALQKFNRGRISKLALARTDLDRTKVSAELQYNWVPRVLGTMMVRPGLSYIGGIRNNSSAIIHPFVFNNSDTALLEFTSSAMRVWVSDAVVVRTGVSSTFTNGTFSSSLTGWTDNDDSGSTSFWITGNYLGLGGGRFARARRRQAVSVASTDASIEHGVKIVIDRGRVNFLCGSSSGGDDYISDTVLRPGTYSFAVTPSSNLYFELNSNTEYVSRVTSLQVESSGDMVVATPWASTDLQNLRFDASADVTFVGCAGVKQQRIERRATKSWGIAEYDPQDGPFRNPDITNTRLAVSALTGDITLSSDKPVFKAGHLGGLFEITSVGQDVSVTVTAGGQFSDAIRVTGVEDTRKFQLLVSSLGSTIGTFRIQRSIGDENSFANVSALAFSSTVDSTHDDGLDNQIAFYRIGIGATDFTGATSSDTAIAALSYVSGGLTGIAQIRSVISATESSASVLVRMGSTAATETWAEGDWSVLRGYPTSVSFHEGRLFWAGKSKLWGSVTDGFEEFDNTNETDSGPINRSMGSGPIDVIPWLQSLGRLVIGSQSREIQAKTSSLEEPIQPLNFSLRDISSQGSANVQAVKIDKRVMFVQAGQIRVMEVGTASDTLDLATIDQTVLVPEIGEPGIIKMAVQRQPDTRVHSVRSDGTVALLLSDPIEDVSGWIDIGSTGASGKIEYVAFLPGTVVYQVYYVVSREINGSTVRYLEKWAKESEAHGGSTNKMGDSLGTFNSAVASTAVTGATHLAGSTEVVAWGAVGSSGYDLGIVSVSTLGAFDVSVASTTVYYGLGYEAWYKSVKLAFNSTDGNTLTSRKKVDKIGFVLADTHIRGLTYGKATDSTFHDLPLKVDGETQTTDKVFTAYDQQAVMFDGEWDTDSRIVLHGQAPRPCTVLGAVIVVDTEDKQ